jgi:hypothetical protein
MTLSNNADHAPWDGDKGLPKCDGSVTNIPPTFMNGLIPQFCSQVADGQAKKTTFTNKDFKKANKFRRTPPPASTQFDGYKFNFEYTGGKDCKKSCSEAFSGILGSCNRETTMLSKGSLNTGCGTYSYSIDNPPPPPPPEPAKPKKADCLQSYSGFFLHYWIEASEKSWGTEDGAKLKEELSGCGAITGWTTYSGNSYNYELNLPVIIAKGCVERAIKSAGGPDISCR